MNNKGAAGYCVLAEPHLEFPTHSPETFCVVHPAVDVADYSKSSQGATA